MKNPAQTFLFALVILTISGANLPAQKKASAARESHQIKVVREIPVTPVKDQHRTGTCWSFATVSFLESELLRTGKGEFDLSEMYFVREAYIMKADKYVRMQGKNNFANGGLAMDVMNVWKLKGMVPQEAYTGQTGKDSLPVHNEMDAVLKGYMDQVIRNPNRELSQVWKNGFEGILDAYLGPSPAIFTHRGASFTPRSFADGLGLDPDDYVVLGSFTHHPFYRSIILEIPDNWNWSPIWNVPLEEMMATLDHALENGYTVCWDADVSEKGFDWDKGISLVPAVDSVPRIEKVITQESRQEGFDNYHTTDDHLMHITGIAKDQDDRRFYMVKNSWGTDAHIYKGFMYASVPYLQAKTIFIMVHREAVPSSLKSRLGL
jgi:bleomycin hydrolase